MLNQNMKYQACSLIFIDCPGVCCGGQCPAGYSHKCGQNVGGILHRGERMNSLKECEEKCTKHVNCHSFSWSPVYKGGWCNANKNSKYVKNQIGDFIFCLKSDFRNGNVSGGKMLFLIWLLCQVK